MAQKTLIKRVPKPTSFEVEKFAQPVKTFAQQLHPRAEEAGEVPPPDQAPDTPEDGRVC